MVFEATICIYSLNLFHKYVRICRKISWIILNVCACECVWQRLHTHFIILLYYATRSLLHQFCSPFSNRRFHFKFTFSICLFVCAVTFFKCVVVIQLGRLQINGNKTLRLQSNWKETVSLAWQIQHWFEVYKKQQNYFQITTFAKLQLENLISVRQNIHFLKDIHCSCCLLTFFFS